MKEVIAIAFSTMLLIALFMASVMLVGALLRCTNEKYHLKIHLKKSKKYDGKVDPIYVMVKNVYEYSESDYSIEKWSIGWDDVESLWLYLLVYPVRIYIWRYVREGDTIFIGNKKEAEDFINNLTSQHTTLGEFYERRMAKSLEDTNAKLLKKKEFEDKLTNINKEFEENYE